MRKQEQQNSAQQNEIVNFETEQDILDFKDLNAENTYEDTVDVLNLQDLQKEQQNSAQKNKIVKSNIKREQDITDFEDLNAENTFEDTVDNNNKEISVSERTKVIKLWKKGESFRKMSKTGLYTSKLRSGRPKNLSDREKRKKNLQDLQKEQQNSAQQNKVVKSNVKTKQDIMDFEDLNAENTFEDTVDNNNKEISVSERTKIIKLWKKGESSRKIGRTVGRTYSSIQGVINNFKEAGPNRSKLRSGRPKKLSDREKRKKEQKNSAQQNEIVNLNVETEQHITDFEDLNEDSVDVLNLQDLKKEEQNSAQQNQIVNSNAKTEQDIIDFEDLNAENIYEDTIDNLQDLKKEQQNSAQQNEIVNSNAKTEQDIIDFEDLNAENIYEDTIDNLQDLKKEQQNSAQQNENVNSNAKTDMEDMDFEDLNEENTYEDTIDNLQDLKKEQQNSAQQNEIVNSNAKTEQDMDFEDLNEENTYEDTIDNTNKEITNKERKKIIKLWNMGQSFRKIGQNVGKTYSTIQGVIYNYKGIEINTSKRRSGRPKKLSDWEKYKKEQQNSAQQNEIVDSDVETEQDIEDFEDLNDNTNEDTVDNLQHLELRRHEISVSERKKIIELWKQGQSFRKIGQTVGRRCSSIQGVVNNFKETGRYTSKPRSGRPKKLSDREKREKEEQNSAQQNEIVNSKVEMEQEIDVKYLKAEHTYEVTVYTLEFTRNTSYYKDHTYAKKESQN